MRLKLTLAALAATAAFASPAVAQVVIPPASDVGTARGTVLRPLSVSEDENLDFGTILVDGSAAGWVEVDAEDGSRSVDGGVPSAGFGLMVHCVQSRSGQLEDYALLIFPSEEPEYEVIMHKQGNQSTLVERTKSDAIKSGSAPNELQVKINGTQMVFYANGKVLTTVTDRENYRRGRVGFYTSDVPEVAFDNLQIERTQ